jgi:hypothetical protein
MKWVRLQGALLQYFKVTTICYFGVILLREVKYLHTEEWVVYIFSILLGILSVIIYKAPEEMFGDKVQMFLFDYSPWIIGGISFILGVIHPRYSIAVNLTILFVSVLFAYTYLAQLNVIGMLSLCTIAAMIFRLVFLTKWSDLLEKKPGVEILK